MEHRRNRMKANLADREASMKLLKQLYGVKDDRVYVERASADGAAGTDGTNAVGENTTTD